MTNPHTFVLPDLNQFSASQAADASTTSCSLAPVSQFPCAVDVLAIEAEKMDDVSPLFRRTASEDSFPTTLQILAPITIGDIRNRTVVFRVERPASCGRMAHSEAVLHLGPAHRHGDNIELRLAADRTMLPPVLGTLSVLEVVRHLARFKSVVALEPAAHLSWSIPTCGIPLKTGAKFLSSTVVPIEVFIGGKFTLAVSYQFPSIKQSFSGASNSWIDDGFKIAQSAAPVSLQYECLDSTWRWELDVVAFFALMSNLLTSIQALGDLVKQVPKIGFYMNIGLSSGSVTITAQSALAENEWRVSRKSAGTIDIQGFGGSFAGGWGVKSPLIDAVIEFEAEFGLSGTSSLWRASADEPWVGTLSTQIRVQLAGKGKVNFLVIVLSASVGSTWSVEIGYGVHAKMPRGVGPAFYFAPDDVKGFIAYGSGGMEGSGESNERVEWTWVEAQDHPRIFLDLAAT